MELNIEKIEKNASFAATIIKFVLYFAVFGVSIILIVNLFQGIVTGIGINDAKKNNHKGIHPALKYPFHHFQAGRVVTKDAFILF